MAGGALDAAVGEALGRAPARGTDVGHVIATTVVMGLNCHNSRVAATRAALAPESFLVRSTQAMSAARVSTTCRIRSIAIFEPQDKNSGRHGARSRSIAYLSTELALISGASRRRRPPGTGR